MHMHWHSLVYTCVRRALRRATQPTEVLLENHVKLEDRDVNKRIALIAAGARGVGYDLF